MQTGVIRAGVTRKLFPVNHDMVIINSLFVFSLGLIACLYAAVGHAGATGYIAVMSLAGLESQIIRPTALSLNILVSGITTIQFARAGHFRGQFFLLLAITSVPAAALGGWLQMPSVVFEIVVGVVLLFSALRIYQELKPGDSIEEVHRRPAAGWLLVLGGGLGFLSGITGVGGGVFLTPALLFLRAAPVKEIAAISAAFILINSIAGVAGWLIAGNSLPSFGISILIAVFVGGLIGSQVGAFTLPPKKLRFLLGVVLLTAGLKLLAQGVLGLSTAIV